MGQARDEAGNIWETDAQGNPVRFVSAAGQQMPADPRFPYQGAQAQAQAANTGAEAQVNQATVPAQIRTANAQATAAERQARTAGLADGQMWTDDGAGATVIPGYTRQGLSPEVRQKAISQYNVAQQLDDIISELRQRFAEGPGSTSGIGGLRDYLPLTENQRFDRAGSGLRGIVRNALGLTGGEANTATEAQMNLGAYVPESSDRDATILDTLGRIEDLRDLARRMSVQTLGGIPDQNGVVTPIPEQPQFNAMTAPRVIDYGPGTQAAQAGATTGADPINPEYQAEYSAWVMQNAGRFTPEQYSAFRQSLDQKYGYGSQDYTDEGARILRQFQQGGSQNLNIPPMDRPLSDEGLLGTGAFSEQARNNALNNPVGAALSGFADMGSFGGVNALLPQQMAALGDAQPLGMGAGQVAGSIAGTSALGKLGAETIGRVAPRTLAGGQGAQFFRNLGTDAAYSGAYGGITGQDPLTSAALGAGGSAFGQGTGKVLGAGVGGLATTPAAQTLRDYGVRLTMGQRLGGLPNRLEDAATSVPFVGDLINARRLEGFQDFNRAAFNEAGAPIGATVKNIGEAGAQELLNQAGNAYDNATAGVRVPFDTQFIRDLVPAERIGMNLPDDLQTKFWQAMDNRLMPLSRQPAMTGEQYQQAFRGLKGYRSEMTKPGFEQDYRDGLTLAMDALTGQMNRGGGNQVVKGLQNADKAYRGGKTLETAVRAARNGSRTGEVQTFAPSQLNDAANAAAKKYGGGRQMAELIDAGQSTLPSQLPDSGTARRVAMMALPGLLGGGGLGAGYGYLTGDTQEGALKGLALAALLAAGGTRAGQKALQTTFMDRPAQAKLLGNAIKRRSGLFGSAALPLLISQ